MSADNKIAFQQSVDAFVAIDTIDQAHADPLGQFPAERVAGMDESGQAVDAKMTESKGYGRLNRFCRIPQAPVRGQQVVACCA